jgi:hypothetical protein
MSLKKSARISDPFGAKNKLPCQQRHKQTQQNNLKDNSKRSNPPLKEKRDIPNSRHPIIRETQINDKRSNQHTSNTTLWGGPLFFEWGEDIFG